jgi:hypothetical protein
VANLSASEFLAAVAFTFHVFKGHEAIAIVPGNIDKKGIQNLSELSIFEQVCRASKRPQSWMQRIFGIGRYRWNISTPWLNGQPGSRFDKVPTLHLASN